MSEGSAGRKPGVPRDMPDQQADAESGETEETADDVPGTDEAGSRPRGRSEETEESPHATPEPHEPTD
jgi:hypothetical protein